MSALFVHLSPQLSVRPACGVAAQVRGQSALCWLRVALANRPVKLAACLWRRQKSGAGGFLSALTPDWLADLCSAHRGCVRSGDHPAPALCAAANMREKRRFQLYIRRHRLFTLSLLPLAVTLTPPSPPVPPPPPLGFLRSNRWLLPILSHHFVSRFSPQVATCGH